MKPQRGMVFGVFDGLHEGHKHFLEDAAKECEVLIVAVAPEEAAQTLKGRTPKVSLTERIEALTQFIPSALIVPGDEVAGSWSVLKAHQPNLVILGYDQKALAAELEKLAIPYIYMNAHDPQRFKSSLLNGT